MKWLTLFFLFIIIISCDDDAEIPGNNNNNNNNNQNIPDWEFFQIESLSDSLTNNNLSFQTFISRPAMEVGYLELNTNELDQRVIPENDQLYYVFDGSGRMNLDQEIIEIEQGDIIFAGSGAKGIVYEVIETVKIVFIYRKSTPPGNPVGNSKFSSGTLAVSSTSSQNIWNPFLNRSNLILGMYSLPMENGGDSRLTHSFEEFNIVVNGSSKFNLGGTAIDIQPGSMVFVNQGLGHSFQNLTSDVDVLIFWEQP